MANPAKPSPAVVAAAIVAILCALFVLLVAAIGLFGALHAPQLESAPQIPPFLRAAGMAFMAFLMCLSIFGMATGAGLLFLRNWARISILIWASFSVFFGAIGIPLALLVPLAPPPNAPSMPAESLQAVRWVLLIGYSLPLLLGIWWLVLFNRKSIKVQFARTAKSIAAGFPPKPRAPLPIAVLAWLFISTAANIFLLPILPFPVPVIFFGRVIHGAAGTALLILTCALFVASGAGLLKLKPWSYPLTIALQLLFLASAMATSFSPDYESQISSFLADFNKSLHLSPSFYSSPDYLHHFRWTIYLALLTPAVILALLLVYRKRFLEAASAAGTRS